mmetsp:Transcript_9579/g.22003  ORF Transcript_9579/g.22003 Transcript_9579/m.22003 type:complete len:395 (+) Transcript_9579:43-1227(+)
MEETGRKKVSRRAWSLAEEEQLKAAVAKFGKRWSFIAKQFENRTLDQCRERWRTHLDPRMTQFNPVCKPRRYSLKAAELSLEGGHVGGDMGYGLGMGGYPHDSGMGGYMDAMHRGPWPAGGHMRHYSHEEEGRTPEYGFDPQGLQLAPDYRGGPPRGYEQMPRHHYSPMGDWQQTYALPSHGPRMSPHGQDLDHGPRMGGPHGVPHGGHGGPHPGSLGALGPGSVRDMPEPYMRGEGPHAPQESQHMDPGQGNLRDREHPADGGPSAFQRRGPSHSGLVSLTPQDSQLPALWQVLQGGNGVSQRPPYPGPGQTVDARSSYGSGTHAPPYNPYGTGGGHGPSGATGSGSQHWSPPAQNLSSYGPASSAPPEALAFKASVPWVPSRNPPRDADHGR